jgi:hypothetical protein
VRLESHALKSETEWRATTAGDQVRVRIDLPLHAADEEAARAVLAATLWARPSPRSGG